MADEIPPNTMNLDLNLGPVVPSSEDDQPETINFIDWLDGSVREVIGHRTRIRQRWRSVWRPVPIPLESRNMALELIGGSGLETGEGSVAADERPSEVTKTCDTGSGGMGNEAVGKEDNVEKGNSDEGSFFDCNICLDLASDPVVTCCGHLFCWSCLYRWLHVHSETKECPICKGEVTIKTVTPIYGRGNHTHAAEEDSSLKIPNRPQAKRVESWRQTIQRNAFSMPVEEMIRRLGSRFDLTGDLVNGNPIAGDNPRDFSDRSSSLLNRFFTSRGMRREQNMATATATTAATETVAPGNAAGDSEQSSPTNSEAGGSSRLSTLLSRRSNRAASISNLTSALSSAERLVDPDFRSFLVERNQERPPSMDDRDSISSIAAIIQSESQTVDTAVEIDSRVSLSTSSSRRRSESSRVSDVDSGDSRAPRRRRLN